MLCAPRHSALKSQRRPSTAIHITHIVPADIFSASTALREARDGAAKYGSIRRELIRRKVREREVMRDAEMEARIMGSGGSGASVGGVKAAGVEQGGQVEVDGVRGAAVVRDGGVSRSDIKRGPSEREAVSDPNSMGPRTEPLIPSITLVDIDSEFDGGAETPK